MSTDEISALKDQVRDIQVNQNTHIDNQQKLEATLDGIKEDIQAIRVALVGDPNQDRPSIIMRLDRLEQSEKLRSKVVWLIGSGLVGLILEKFRGLF